MSEFIQWVKTDKLANGYTRAMVPQPDGSVWVRPATFSNAVWQDWRLVSDKADSLGLKSVIWRGGMLVWEQK